MGIPRVRVEAHPSETLWCDFFLRNGSQIDTQKIKLGAKFIVKLSMGRSAGPNIIAFFPYSGKVCQQEKVVTTPCVLNTIFRH